MLRMNSKFHQSQGVALAEIECVGEWGLLNQYTGIDTMITEGSSGAERNIEYRQKTIIAHLTVTHVSICDDWMEDASDPRNQGWAAIVIIHIRAGFYDVIPRIHHEYL